MHLAVILANIEIIKELLKNENIDVNMIQTFKRTYPCINSGHHQYHSKTALYMATEKESIDIISLLLSNKNNDLSIPYIFVNNVYVSEGPSKNLQH